MKDKIMAHRCTRRPAAGGGSAAAAATAAAVVASTIPAANADWMLVGVLPVICYLP